MDDYSLDDAHSDVRKFLDEVEPVDQERVRA